jgi:hypothetical protein
MLDDETREAVEALAIVALHKQLRSVAELRITKEDFDWHADHEAEGFEMEYDSSNGDIILRHRQPRSDA